MRYRTARLEKYFLKKTIMSTIAANLQAVEATIQAACEAANRPRSTVQLLAVSKTFPAEAVLEAIEAGQRAFGENYVQEGVDKIAAVAKARPGLMLEWHFIGPIQSNKTRPIATSFQWVHTVERLKIAQRLSEQRPSELGPLDICLQVNISGEATKSGVKPEELEGLAKAVVQLPNLPCNAPRSHACAHSRKTSSKPASTSTRCRWACPATCSRPCWKARPSYASAAPSSARAITSE